MRSTRRGQERLPDGADVKVDRVIIGESAEAPLLGWAVLAEPQTCGIHPSINDAVDAMVRQGAAHQARRRCGEGL